MHGMVYASMEPNPESFLNHGLALLAVCSSQFSLASKPHGGIVLHTSTALCVFNVYLTEPKANITVDGG
jgi:hypothetical protein